MTAENDLIRGRYQLGKVIGGGSMGSVYCGTDILTGEIVAIKALRAELTASMPKMVERFLREGEVLRRLNHPNIIKVLATVDESSQHYIIEEYASGGSLAELLTRSLRLPVEQTVAVTLELSDALSRAHHLHILHRDIKPANILLAADGTPRLSDFGLAHIECLPGLTESGSILGTFYYLSPEAVEHREINERSDIWSLGVVLFEMLTGRLPFSGKTPFEVIWAIKNQPVPPLENFRSGIPAALANLVGRMLRKDNTARITSMRQVGVELEKIQRELTAQQEKAAFSKGTAPVLETNAAARIRVLIADDHAVVRQGLRMFIDLQDDMEVVGEATNGIEAVQLAARLMPDIMLLDLVMPELDGVAATGQIKTACPVTRVIILTSFGEDDKVFPALQAGAQGYLLKDIHPEKLVQAVRDAWAGKTQLAPEVAARLLQKLQNPDSSY